MVNHTLKILHLLQHWPFWDVMHESVKKPENLPKFGDFIFQTCFFFKFQFTFRFHMFKMAGLAHKKSSRGPLIFISLQSNILEKHVLIPPWRLPDH